jgi:hypothetical protein
MLGYPYFSYVGLSARLGTSTGLVIWAAGKYFSG